MPRLAPVDAAWPEAMKGSNNGFYIVLVALGWWAQGAKFAGQDMKAWDQATADVTWVLDQLKLVAEFDGGYKVSEAEINGKCTIPSRSHHTY